MRPSNVSRSQTTATLFLNRTNIIKIQKSFRGALGRKLFENKLQMIAKERRMKVYNEKAKMVQKLYVFDMTVGYTDHLM